MGGGNFTNLSEPVSVEHLKKTAAEIYPALYGIGWQFKWDGQVAITTDHTPCLFKLAENVHAGMVFNSHGVAMCSMFGIQLARVVLGEEPDMTIEPTEIVPNHAFRQLGLAWFLVSGCLLDRGDMQEATATWDRVRRCTSHARPATASAISTSAGPCPIGCFSSAAPATS
ncbi:MAG: FAD-binding oxidoreductase [Rhodospirillales bacterium]|nr:FAD-binding oxidoreductase [Rhodospirillales bacterium]